VFIVARWAPGWGQGILPKRLNRSRRPQPYHQDQWHRALRRVAARVPRGPACMSLAIRWTWGRRRGRAQKGADHTVIVPDLLVWPVGASRPGLTSSDEPRTCRVHDTLNLQAQLVTTTRAQHVVTPVAAISLAHHRLSVIDEPLAGRRQLAGPAAHPKTGKSMF